MCLKPLVCLFLATPRIIWHIFGARCQFNYKAFIVSKDSLSIYSNWLINTADIIFDTIIESIW